MPSVRRVLLRPECPERLWSRAGGLSLLERQAFGAARAGARELLVAAADPGPGRRALLRLPDGLEVRWAPSPPPSDGPELELSADFVWRREPLSSALRDRSGLDAVYETPAGERLARLRSGASGGRAAERRLLGPDEARRFGRGPASEDAAWLLDASSRAEDGLMARLFDRRISRAVSRRLLGTSVSPNAMTLVSVALGLAGAACFLAADFRARLLGALLVWLHSVLDGCDGELARTRFQETPFGADLDFWGDNLVHLALFSGLGAGLWRETASTRPLELALAADLAVAASAWTAWLRRRGGGPAGVVDEAPGDGLDARLARVENALAQRDFIYLLVLAALLSRLEEFLWAAALGGLLYFAVMLYLRRDKIHEQPRQPHPAR